MKQPLTGITILYCAGILLGALPVPLPHLFAVAFLLAAIFPFWRNAGRVIIGFLILLAGWINQAQRMELLSPNDLRTTLPAGQELAIIRGRLSETPRHRVHDVRNREVWSSMARLEATEVRILSLIHI